jgi:hypothetical protein
LNEKLIYRKEREQKERVVSAGGSKNEEAGIESKVEEGVGYDNGVG